jgi:hypothetical protein
VVQPRTQESQQAVPTTAGDRPPMTRRPPHLGLSLAGVGGGAAVRQLRIS